MRKGFFLNLGLALILIALTLAATQALDGHAPLSARHKPEASAQAALEKVPDAVLVALDGSKENLHDFEGKTILLSFWASWCLPCKVEFPQFLALARAMPDDLVILAVSADDHKENITPFLEKYAKDLEKTPNVKIFWDKDKSIMHDIFNTVRLPETIIIGPDLVMRDKVVGLALEWDSEEAKQMLRQTASY